MTPSTAPATTTAPASTAPSDPTSLPQSSLPQSNQSNKQEGEGEEITSAREQGHSQAQETFTGVAEPETLSPSLARTGSGSASGSGSGSGSEGQGEGQAGGEGYGEQGKLPFKEQVKAYAKVHRGTILGDVRSPPSISLCA